MSAPIPNVEAKDLTPDQYRLLVAHRARQILHEPVAVPETTAERHLIEARIKAEMERIHLRRNFLPVRFLGDGVERAKAVCRIVTNESLGTGFLVGPGLLMTNNHVIDRREAAQGAIAEFGLNDSASVPITAALLPDRFFMTDEDLDFTIVACDASRLGDVRPIPLRRSPVTVTRHEFVNIIQHPAGRPKEVALQENTVTRVQDKLIHYETDTERGSSGSPVFNNNWDLVALHHSGTQLPDGTAENEGIRISAIVAHLIAVGQGDSVVREALGRDGMVLLGTSPFLGFFDVQGVAPAGSLEVEVPDFRGSVQFADVGFWNIEHFRSDVSEERVAAVAEVVSRLSMDVLGLTEVEKGALERLKEALSRHGLAVGFELLDTDGRQDLAVLYDRETTRVLLRPDLAARYANLLAARTRSGRSAFPRAPLFASCTIRGEGSLGEQRFLLILVHLKAFGDPQSVARRQLAARILAEIIKDLREVEGLPVVLGGDFNEQLTTDVLDPLTGAPDLLALTADDANDGAISYVGTTHRSLIDHVLVSSDVQLGEISGDDAAIVRLDRSVRDFSGRVSDHVPIVFRMIYRSQGVPIEPELPEEAGGAIEIPLPDGSRSVRLAFELA
ncbi:MAG TPA: trypsin-like peptidase domain-containing protein [Thermoanaerobaculia bacterium]|nr:trypsin-like peptidase domain-containing protein [Thermoanaerobaculia bacterium]